MSWVEEWSMLAARSGYFLDWRQYFCCVKGENIVSRMHQVCIVDL